MKKTLLLAGAAIAAFSSVANAQNYYRGQNYYNYPQYNTPQYAAPGYQQQPQYYSQQKNYNYGIRPYIGLDYVYSMSDTDISNVDLLEEDLNAFAVSMGIKFNQYVGLEAFYQQSEEGKKTTSNLIINGQRVDELEVKYKYKAYGLDLIGYLPLNPQFDLLGTVGLGYYDAELSTKADIGEGNVSDDGFGWRVGVGGQFNITDNWGIRVMARYVDPDIEGLKNMVDISAGIRYTF